MVSFKQKTFPGGVFLEGNNAKMENAIANELIFQDHITIDQSLESIFDLTKSVHMRAKIRKDPECVKYTEHFTSEIPLLEEKVNEYRELAKSGDIDSILLLCEKLCELGDAYRHIWEKYVFARKCYMESLALLLKIAGEVPSLLPKISDLIYWAGYGDAFTEAFISQNTEEALKAIEICCDISDFDSRFRSSYRLLDVLRSVLSDDPKTIDNITYEFNNISDIFEYIGEYNYLDMLLIAKAYVKIALYNQTKGNHFSAKNYITEGYHRIPSNFIRSIYARDLWKLAAPFSESGITDGASLSHNKNDIFDNWFSGEDMAKAYLANIYFTFGESESFPFPDNYITAWKYAVDILESQRSEIEKYRKAFKEYENFINDCKNNPGLLLNPSTKETYEKVKDSHSKLIKYFDAINFIIILRNLAALHAFAVIQCCGDILIDFTDFKIPVETLNISQLRGKVLQGACYFHKACITADKKQKADYYKKSYNLLSALMDNSFDERDISDYRRYEQVTFAAGYIALAELIGNKKCGIGSDTAKAKEILDNVRYCFNKKESEEYFKEYYSRIKKSLFGGYSFKWIAK